MENNEEYVPLNYNKVNIPVVTQTAIPNPDNQAAEATYYQYLQFKYVEARTDIGQEIWISPSSGITYNTNDPKWIDNKDIYNRGEEGMMNLLNKTFSGKNGWIITAYDFNMLANNIDSMVDGRITVNNSYNLNGHPDTYFCTKKEYNDIVNGTTIVGNADLLDGFDSSYFCTKKQYDDVVSGITMVGNSDKLDGFDSSYFAKQTSLDTTNNNITKIINGTTVVGKAGYATNAGTATTANNAINLGGRPASYYQSVASAVNVYAGQGGPSASLGKNGDIYVLY